MGDNTSQVTTQTLAHPMQTRTTKTRTLFEAIHETRPGDVVLHLQMEFPIYKPNSLLLRYHRGHNHQLGQDARLRVMMPGLNASLL